VEVLAYRSALPMGWDGPFVLVSQSPSEATPTATMKQLDHVYIHVTGLPQQTEKKKTRKKPGKTGPELERLSLEIG
jgi:hypothetical protein